MSGWLSSRPQGLPALADALEAVVKAGPLEVIEAAANHLARLRPMDHQGAKNLLANMPELTDILSIPEDLARLILDLAGEKACLGCGTCCRTSSPTLYRGDLDLIEKKKLPRRLLYTLKSGENVYSARLDKVYQLTHDLIKIKETSDGACLHLTENLCSVYQCRPLQCRVLECWTGRNASELKGEPLLERGDLFAHNSMALNLAAEFDLKVPPAELHSRLEEAAQGSVEASRNALELIEVDQRLRHAIAAHYPDLAREIELLLGRPALSLVRPYGLQVRLDAEGQPCLTPLR